MNATPAERTKASRLRKLAKERTLTPSEREWLDAYERTRASVAAQRPKPPPVPDASPAPVPTGDVSSPAASASAAGPGEASAAEKPHEHVIDFGAPTDTKLATLPEAPTCAIPDCPACAKARGGGLTCLTTGEKVYPRMSEEGAKGMAAGLLNVLALVISIGKRIATGKPAPIVSPMPHEIELTGKALREAIYRRASYMGQGDDLMALAWAIGSFGMRAGAA